MVAAAAISTAKAPLMQLRGLARRIVVSRGIAIAANGESFSPAMATANVTKRISSRLIVSSPPFGSSNRIVAKAHYRGFFNSYSTGHTESNSTGTNSGTNNGTTTTAADDNNNEISEDFEPENDHSHLLTRATARQLKGDVPQAIVLTQQALEIQQKKKKKNSSLQFSDHNHNEEEIADTLLFLGKLHQLEGSLETAMDSFAESRDLYRKENETAPTLSERIQRKELVALSHLASAKGRWLLQEENKSNSSSSNSNNNNTSKVAYDDASTTVEDDFSEALKGLEKIAGWEDGMTNHTAHEWSLYCRHTLRDPEKALQILSNMKENLSEVFGSEDHRVLQLNGEMAELWRHISSKTSSSGDNTHRNDTGGTSEPPTTTNTNTTTSNQETAEKNAMALLEEALDKLAPNSPEARRIFMQLEEWKEAQEQKGKHIEGVVVPGNQGGGGSAATSSTRNGGVVVTVTRGKSNR